jgi:Cu(I)/Ag(I) efflux system periplasmic protein CusF
MRTKLLTLMTAAGLALAAPAVAQGDAVSATGTIKKVDQAKRTVNLSHGPIPAVNWPAMTMDFAVAPEVDLSALKPGQQVEFKMKGSGMTYTITEVKPKR